jgi:hypothetical protein
MVDTLGCVKHTSKTRRFGMGWRIAGNLLNRIVRRLVMD